MPGVLIIEGMAQTAGAICIAAQSTEGPPPVVYFMTIDKAKFRRPVVPGDQLRMEVRVVQNRGRTVSLRGEAFVDGALVTEADMMARIVDR